MNCGMYIPLAGYSATLVKGLPVKGRFLPVAKAQRMALLEALEWWDYTYLLLELGEATELVKVQNFCGRILLTRGMEGTSAKAFPCDVVAQYLLTPQGVIDIVRQGYDYEELSNLVCDKTEGEK